MSKKIYWIDDSTANMLKVVHGLFPRLWEVSQDTGIATGIIILGDAYKASETEKGWTSKDERDLKEKIDDFFLGICQDEDGINGGNKTYEIKKELIDGVVKILFCTDENKKILDEVMKYWKDENKLKCFDKEEADKITKKLLDTIGILKDGDCIAVDIVLLYGDRERVKQEDYPMLSMSLCNCIMNIEKKPCFLYSSYFFDQEFIDKWKEKYKKIYGQKVPRIFRRTELSPKNVADNIVNEIKHLINDEKQEIDNVS